MKAMSSNFGNFITMLVFVFVFVIIFSVASNILLNPPSPVEVTDCSLTSDTVNSGGQASITFTLQSNDENSEHLVRVELSSYYLVDFFLGYSKLPKEDGIWYYEEPLNPKSTHTQLIDVRPTLESGIAELKYRIAVVFYMDGAEIYNKNLDLTVRRP